MYDFFKIEEFKCKCCNDNKISPAFVWFLDKARSIAGIPFVINSGYRCATHNKAVGGSPTSSHLEGLAVDIKATTSRDKFIIVNALIKAGIMRIGIAKTFIHCDMDCGKSQKVIWTY